MTNRCSFPFDEDFKALIKNERESPEVQALKTCNKKDHFEKVQETLRVYLKQKYPTYFKIRYSDMFAFAIALIHPHLDECTMWEDVKFHCPDESNPDVGFDWTYNTYFQNMKSTCVCGHSITASNSYIVYHRDGPLRIVVGCCCIEKNEIVDDFPLVKKRRKEHLKKLEQQHIKKWTDYNEQLMQMHRTRIQQQIDTWKSYNDTLMQMHQSRKERLQTETRLNLFPARQFFTICKNLKKLEKQHIKKWTDYNEQLMQMHRTRIQQQIDTWKSYNDTLMQMHRTRTHTSCQYCKKRVQTPYQVCFGCRETHYDKCDCGKSKQKQYPRCYTCAKS